MLNTFGNQKQFQFLRKSTKKALITLGKKDLRTLIQTDFLSIAEKLEIVELNLGLRFLTEATSYIKYSERSREDGLKYPTEKSVKELESFLNTKLPFPTKISKRKSNRLGIYACEINIFTNQTLKEYFDKYEKRVSDLEIGILFGYHPKAVLAFCGYVKSCPPPKLEKAYQYYNSKVFPADSIAEVEEYHKQRWEIVRKLSPELIQMAEEEFKSIKVRSQT